MRGDARGSFPLTPGPLPEGEGDIFFPARLPKNCVRLNAAIERIERAGDRWRLDVRAEKKYLPLPPGEGRGEGETTTGIAPHPNPLPEGEGTEFDAMIIATAAPAAAKLLNNTAPNLAIELAAIESRRLGDCRAGLRSDADFASH